MSSRGPFRAFFLPEIHECWGRGENSTRQRAPGVDEARRGPTRPREGETRPSAFRGFIQRALSLFSDLAQGSNPD